MIYALEGVIVKRVGNLLGIKVDKTTYRLLVPVNDCLTVGDSIEVFVAPVHSEQNGLTLFGFETEEARDLFELIIDKVNGVGPKTALSLFNKLSAHKIKEAIKAEDASLLKGISGVGPKTAARIVADLSGNISLIAPSKVQVSNPVVDQAERALVSLGIGKREAQLYVSQAFQANTQLRDVSKLVQAALALQSK